MPPREKDDVVEIDKYNSFSINLDNSVSNEKAWLFEDALKLIGMYIYVICNFESKQMKCNIFF